MTLRQLERFHVSKYLFFKSYFFPETKFKTPLCVTFYLYSILIFIIRLWKLSLRIMDAACIKEISCGLHFL